MKSHILNVGLPITSFFKRTVPYSFNSRCFPLLTSSYPPSPVLPFMHSIPLFNCPFTLLQREGKTKPPSFPTPTPPGDGRRGRREATRAKGKCLFTGVLRAASWPCRHPCVTEKNVCVRGGVLNVVLWSHFFFFVFFLFFFYLVSLRLAFILIVLMYIFWDFIFVILLHMYIPFILLFFDSFYVLSFRFFLLEFYYFFLLFFSVLMFFYPVLYIYSLLFIYLFSLSLLLYFICFIRVMS